MASFDDISDRIGDALGGFGGFWQDQTSLEHFNPSYSASESALSVLKFLFGLIILTPLLLVGWIAYGILTGCAYILQAIAPPLKNLGYGLGAIAVVALSLPLMGVGLPLMQLALQSAATATATGLAAGVGLAGAGLILTGLGMTLAYIGTVLLVGLTVGILTSFVSKSAAKAVFSMTQRALLQDVQNERYDNTEFNHGQSSSNSFQSVLVPKTPQESAIITLVNNPLLQGQSQKGIENRIDRVEGVGKEGQKKSPGV